MQQRAGLLCFEVSPLTGSGVRARDLKAHSVTAWVTFEHRAVWPSGVHVCTPVIHNIKAGDRESEKHDSCHGAEFGWKNFGPQIPRRSLNVVSADSSRDSRTASLASPVHSGSLWLRGFAPAAHERLHPSHATQQTRAAEQHQSVLQPDKCLHPPPDCVLSSL